MAEISPQSIFSKTHKGTLAVRNGTLDLPRDVGLVFLSVDGKASADELLTRSGMSADLFYRTLDTLVGQQFISRVSERPADPAPSQAGESGSSETLASNRVRELRERVQARLREREGGERKGRGSTTANATVGPESAAAAAETFPRLDLGENVAEVGAPRTAESRGGTGAVSESAGFAANTLSDAAQAALARDHAQVLHTADTDVAPDAAKKAGPSITLENDHPLRERVIVDRAAYDLLKESAHPLEIEDDGSDASRQRQSAARESGVRAARAPGSPFAARITTALLLVLVAIPVFGALWLQFMPLPGFVPDAERVLSERTGQPVTVANVRYVLLPAARLIVEGVRIGTPPSNVRIGRIEAHASPFAIIAKPPRFSRIEATDVVLSPAALTALPSRMNGGDESGLRPDLLRLKNMRFDVEGLDKDAFESEIAFASDGSVKHVRLDGEGLKIQLVPLGQGFALQADGSGWTLPLAAPLQFNYFTARGTLRDGQLTLSELTGRAAGGAVQATLAAHWSGRLTMHGNFSVRNVRLEQLLPMLTPDVAATGTLEMAGSYELQGSTYQSVLDSLRVDATFTATRGELANLNLLRGFNAPGAMGSHGGRTAFDTLSGTLQITPAGYTYRQVRLSSGPFNAFGALDVSGEGKLSGRFNAQLMLQTQIAARSSFAVAGTVKEPVVQR